MSGVGAVTTPRPLVEQVADLVWDARERGHSPLVRARAAVCTAHALHCAVAGRDLPWSLIATGLSEHVGAGPATGWADGRRLPVEEAAFVNAALAQSTLAEDMHAPSLSHPGSVVVSAALAVGEQVGADGAALRDAVVAGYDVMCVLGSQLKTKHFTARGFRPSGVFGPLGAATAAALLLDLDRDGLAAAIGIAASTSGGLREWANAGSTDVFFHNAFAARNGIRAAELAAAGVTGPSTVLEGAAGLAQAFAGERAAATGLADRWRSGSGVLEVYFKRHPACGAVQSVITLVGGLAQTHRFELADVESATVRTHAHGTTNPGCDYAGPWGSVTQAQMSNQMAFALAVETGGHPTVSDYRRHDDPEIRDAAGLVSVVEDPWCTEVYPAESRARVEIILTDGRHIASELSGGAELTDDDVYVTAEQTFADAYGVTRAAQLVRGLRDLDDVANVADLTALMRR